MASQSQGFAKPVVWLVGVYGFALDSEELHVDFLFAIDVSLHSVSYQLSFEICWISLIRYQRGCAIHANTHQGRSSFACGHFSRHIPVNLVWVLSGQEALADQSGSRKSEVLLLSRPYDR